jgi:hypothetical protein
MHSMTCHALRRGAARQNARMCRATLTCQATHYWNGGSSGWGSRRSERGHFDHQLGPFRVWSAEAVSPHLELWVPDISTIDAYCLRVFIRRRCLAAWTAWLTSCTTSSRLSILSEPHDLPRPSHSKRGLNVPKCKSIVFVILWCCSS